MNKSPFLLKMRKENNGQCREKNEKLCKVKACRKVNLRYENGYLVPVSALHRVSKTKFSFGAPKSVRLIQRPPYTATMVILCELAKAIAHHSLTGLNIIIFHDGLFNISYCHYNQQEKLENNDKTSFWKSKYFFKKSEGTHMLGPPPPLPLFVFVCFSMTPCSFLFAFQWPQAPLPLSFPQRTYFLSDRKECEPVQ